MYFIYIGCIGDIDSLIYMSFRIFMVDGWGGFMIGICLSDILFGILVLRRIEVNLVVLEENKVNIILYGYELVLLEMIVLVLEELDLVVLVKEVGVDGINLVGMCCIGNEIIMRYGVKIVGDFY